jgi:(S)-2-hydroxy-acid oxidase
MNRLPTLDPHVITIADLKDAACKDMPKMYRGVYVDAEEVVQHCSQ